MSRKVEINAGDRYSRLTIVKEVEPYIYHNGKKKTKVLCKCDCGNYKEIQLGSIRSRSTTSCGCYSIELTCKLNANRATHGLRKHRLYNTWAMMLDRCNNPKNKRFKDWGGRGIKVCERWHDVRNFINDMFSTFKEGLTLDRIDNDKWYSKDNCKWSNRSEQALNKRVIGKVPYRGVSFYKMANKYVSQIQYNGKKKYLGSFNNPLSAALSYDRFVIENNLTNQLNFNL